MLTCSVWSAYFMEMSPEDMIDEFLRAGFTATEFSDEHGAMMVARGNVEKEGRKLKELAADRGFSFPQGHLLLRADICAPDAEATLKPWLDLFMAMGIRAGVLHAAGGADLADEERFERRVRTLSALARHVRGSDFTICLENLMGTRYPKTAEELNALIDAVGDDRNLGICLDTGHLNVKEQSEKQSQADFIRKAGARLKALHIADNDTSGDQHMMPYGVPFAKGAVDWPPVMRALREVGYDRLFNMEVPGERDCPLPVRRHKLAYSRRLCEYLLTEAGT